MAGETTNRRSVIPHLILPLIAAVIVGWAAVAEEESPGEAKFPGEKWKLVNVVNISGDAMKFAFGDKGEGMPEGGKIVIREFKREEIKAEPVEILKFYRGKLKDPKAEPMIQVLSPEDNEAMEIYLTRAKKGETPQFCLVSVDSTSVTVIEIVSQMVDEVLKSLGTSMESISDSIRKEMEIHRKEMEKSQQELKESLKALESKKQELKEELDGLEDDRIGLIFESIDLEKRLQEIEKEVEKNLEVELVEFQKALADIKVN